MIVVGAGLSGIGTACRLREKCPDKTFTILEARDRLGGTWDLFRYPGVRSDSDMFTFGYRFRPWQEPQALAAGEDILDYLRETATAYGIDRHIRYRHRMVSANWSDQRQQWTLTVDQDGQSVTLTTRFLYLCCGYYNYAAAHRPTFAGEADFAGRIVVPQFWPADLDYAGKRIVVVGSGATAVTLVPTLAETATHVTMLQRSPTYVMTLPNRNALYLKLRRWLPESVACRLARWTNLALGTALFGLTRVVPDRVRRFIRKQAAQQLGPGVDVDTHFNPQYDPWDQRLCLVPDGDLFRVLRNGRAEVVTDHIERFTAEGLRLASGRELAADLVVLATGLQVQLFGGAELRVDGQPVAVAEEMVYKGMLLSGVPNCALAFGYTNASWTLKTDLTAEYVCALLRYMDRRGYATVTPRRQADVAPEPLLNFSAGYVQRAGGILPQQGHRRPWRVCQNYFMDALQTRLGRIDDGVLAFERTRGG